MKISWNIHRLFFLYRILDSCLKNMDVFTDIWPKVYTGFNVCTSKQEGVGSNPARVAWWCVFHRHSESTEDAVLCTRRCKSKIKSMALTCFTFTLLHFWLPFPSYKWGKQTREQLSDAISVAFSIDKTLDNRNFLLSLSLKLCIAEVCAPDINILQEFSAPIPFCNTDGTLEWPQDLGKLEKNIRTKMIN